MKVSIQAKVAPKLRFPEFTGEWQVKKLEDLASIERGRFSPRPRNDPRFYGGNIPFVQTSDVVKSNGNIINYSQTLNEAGLRVSKLFPKGTILITIAANIGHAGVLEVDMACPDSLIGIKCKETVDASFVNYYLATQQPRMDRIASEAAQKNINIEFLRPYPIPYTGFSEQKKIAEFLTAVDDRIGALQKKVQLLEKYKKGVMQAIFTQKIRFKGEDGKDYPDWASNKLGDIARFSKGKDISKDDVIVNGRFECIRYGELYTQYKEVVDRVYSKINLDLEKLVLSKQGDVIIPSSGETNIDIATASCVMREGIALGGDINIIRTEQNGAFLAYYLRNARKFEIAKLAQGNSVVHLYSSQLKSLQIQLPTKKEQRKICDFLIAIDDKINLTKRELMQARIFKQALLQQMFL